MKRIIASFLALVMLSLVCACGGKTASSTPSAAGSTPEISAAAPVDVKVLQVGWTTAPDPNDPYNVFATKMAELVKEKSGGSVRIDTFPSGQLGQEREMLEGMQMGTVDMGVITNAYASMFVPACGLFDLPFLFADGDTAHKILDGDVGTSVLDSFKGQGFTGLAWGEGGFRHLVTVNTPVRKPADFKGLKLRCMETQAYLDTYAALGANAVPMAWAEVLTGLQQKTIEGLDIPISVIYSNGFPQIAKYLCLTGHFYSPLIMCISDQALAKLTADEQAMLKQCAVEAGQYNRSHNTEVEAELLKKMEDGGMTIVRDIDYQAFRDTLSTFYDSQKERIGASYVDALMKELA